ncbi:hypothetical protein PHLGIDRAFT_461135 [Phlebiopsis gigantea 11061_1 CR5-6]|uniref:Uncharacterized protein n=1 Tax=Phlebiopsis gigantea (strain 11061_1 CR5-6) TaxID=745531 RepID=A0A0C3S6W8_PHLG1|nr:hypothetical protein PHLGIDRAFT_461135 [Phlebiopsis gigantea 11061_1 CR5-6]
MARLETHGYVATWKKYKLVYKLQLARESSVFKTYTAMYDLIYILLFTLMLGMHSQMAISLAQSFVISFYTSYGSEHREISHATAAPLRR